MGEVASFSLQVTKSKKKLRNLWRSYRIGIGTGPGTDQPNRETSYSPSAPVRGNPRDLREPPNISKHKLDAPRPGWRPGPRRGHTFPNQITKPTTSPRRPARPGNTRSAVPTELFSQRLRGDAGKVLHRIRMEAPSGRGSQARFTPKISRVWATYMKVHQASAFFYGRGLPLQDLGIPMVVWDRKDPREIPRSAQFLHFAGYSFPTTIPPTTMSTTPSTPRPVTGRPRTSHARRLTKSGVT